MDTLKIVWLPQARIQFHEIITYWAEELESVSYVQKIREDVQKVLEILKFSPRIGRTVEDTNEEVRRVTILRNYSIFYKWVEDYHEIQIIAFWDNRNDPNKLDLSY
jgi:putative stabilisation protein